MPPFRTHRFAVLAAFSLAASLTLPARAEHTIPPATDASQYPAHVTHDGITIAADPYDRRPKEDVFRVDYLKFNFLPIRIIVSNNTDRPISLNDVRILLIPKVGVQINAGAPEDVERRVSSNARYGTTIPIGPLKIHKNGKEADSKVETDFSEHEYSALAVEPHTTRAGFLFYDAQGLGGNPLVGATLLFREIRDADGKELFAFEVPMDAYLSAKH